jgi:aminopeptidase N
MGLKLGEKNTVCIAFKQEYATDGNGLHRYVDSDGLEYLYSSFEPCWALNMFPCFDQPNLKGTFELEVLTNSEWTIISNEICILEAAYYDPQNYDA